ncbi:MAG TPA: class I SAM-dependent methyltransferase family protein [archaeon]|nr:class I SAM-dependent methyltransferase family protein [archaeon]
MPSSGVKVERKSAQKVHLFLLENALLEKSLKPIKNDEIIFPVREISQKQLVLLKKISKSISIVSMNFETRELLPKNMKDALSGKLSNEELSLVQSSYDSLGDVAIVEIPEELKGKEKVIGNALMDSRNAIKSVYMKTGAHTGVFRREPVKYIAGEKRKYAFYKEHGCTFRISLGKVFFSPRLSTERARIASKIKKGEFVAALFAGVGPFPIVFAKKSKMEKAIAIELNPVAVADMKENIKLNKVEAKVEPVLGDVKKLVKKYKEKFDRAVMPLPKSSEDFLEDAILYIKPSGGTVHFYQFTSRENPYVVPLLQIKKACENLKRKFRVVSKRKVREYAPDIIQVVIDFRVWS